MFREILCVFAVLCSVSAIYSEQDFLRVRVPFSSYNVPTNDFMKAVYGQSYGQKSCVEKTFLDVEQNLMGELVYNYESFGESGISTPLLDVLLDTKAQNIVEMTARLVQNWAHLGKEEKEFIKWSLEQIVYIHSYNMAPCCRGVLGIHMEFGEFGQSPLIQGSCEPEDLAFLLNYYRTAMIRLPRLYYAYNGNLEARWRRTLPKDELYRIDAVEPFVLGVYEGRELILLQGVIDVAGGADVDQVSQNVKHIIGTDEQFLQEHHIVLGIVEDILSAPILPSPVPLPAVPEDPAMSSMSSIYSTPYTSPLGFHRGYFRNPNGRWIKSYPGFLGMHLYQKSVYGKPITYPMQSVYSKPSYSSSYSKDPEATDCSEEAASLQLQGKALLRYLSELRVYSERSCDVLMRKTCNKLVALIDKNVELLETILAHPNLPADKLVHWLTQLDSASGSISVATVTFNNIVNGKDQAVPNIGFNTRRNICPLVDLGLQLSNFFESQGAATTYQVTALGGIYQRIVEYYPRDVAHFLIDQADKAINLLVLDRSSDIYHNVLAVLRNEIPVLVADAQAKEFGIDLFKVDNKMVTEYFEFLNNGEAPPTEPLGAPKSSKPSTYNPYESMSKPSYGTKPSYGKKPSYGSKPSYVPKPYQPKPKPSYVSKPRPYSLYTPTVIV